MSATAIVVAAGAGLRLGRSRPKALVELLGVPLIIHTARALLEAPSISGLVAVLPEGVGPEFEELLQRYGPWRCPILSVPGGAERQQSVKAGLDHASEELVLVHDAARPFVPAEVIEKAIEAARRHGAVIVAMPAQDTVKQVHPDGSIEATLPRERLWLAQTPQVFRLGLLREAHDRAAAEAVLGTDDAFLVERLGTPVYVVPGNPENRKITTPDDLRWAEWLLQTQSRSQP